MIPSTEERRPPWIPPVGYDLHAEKPHQQQWLAMLAAASRYEVVNLRHAICRVLGLPLSASDVTIDDAVRADRRLAEDLAGQYMAARAGKWSP